MTMIAEKIEAAGGKSAMIGARLMTEITEALRRSPSAHADQIWHSVGMKWGDNLVEQIRADMRVNKSGGKGHATRANIGQGSVANPTGPVSGRDSPARNDGVEGQAIVANLANKALPSAPSPQSLKARLDAETIRYRRFKHKTSDGRDWADVGAHELDGMARDGAVAQKIKDKLGVLTNEQRFKSIGELMSAERFAAVLEEIRHAA